MITHSVPSPAQKASVPTIWGLTPTQLHDRCWAARGVQVVRQGEPSDIVDGAELFLLTEPHILTIIDRRVDITGMELSCTIGETWLWGVPFFDDGKFLRDGIVGLKIPAAAVDDVAGIRAHARAKR